MTIMYINALTKSQFVIITLDRRSHEFIINKCGFTTHAREEYKVVKKNLHFQRNIKRNTPHPCM